MTLTVGKKVFYPGQGPCRIDSIIERAIEGTTTRFYRLELLDDSGGEMFIPADKVESIGLRSLLRNSEIPGLLVHLKETVKSADNWKQRSMENTKLISSGSAFDLAEVVGSLTELREAKGLSPAETRMLERAKRLLACELAEVLGTTKEAAEERLDKTLNAKR